jgi:sugar diacid utilization regulator
VLIDPAASAGEAEQVALEHGATVLAMELARLQSLAETELRLGGDLVDDLLAGAEENSAFARAWALGYDLERAHRVVVVEGTGSKSDGDAFFQVVRQSARNQGVGSLLVVRSGLVVMLSDMDPPWEQFRLAVLRDLGGGRCRIGVGGVCDRPADFPRSYHEARLALKIQTAFASGDQATVFDQLGVYRILAEVEDTGTIERFVREWLGSLLDYDRRTRSELVMTLSRYLECGKITPHPPRPLQCIAARSSIDSGASRKSLTMISLTLTRVSTFNSPPAHGTRSFIARLKPRSSVRGNGAITPPHEPLRRSVVSAG